jgi:transcriptional regulator with XRE-family HTH domain
MSVNLTGKDVAKKIRHARENAGWSQEQLASSLGINVSTLSQYERGHLPMPFRVIQGASAALRLPAGYLFDMQKPLPDELPPPPDRPGRFGEEAALLAEWRSLKRHDRYVVILLCKTLRMEKAKKKKKR